MERRKKFSFLALFQSDRVVLLRSFLFHVVHKVLFSIAQLLIDLFLPPLSYPFTVPESMLWLLLTGNVPTVEEVRGLSEELAAKGKLPSYAEKIIDSFPKTMRE